MKCPYCECQDTRVIDSRESAELDVVRRRRQCVACMKRFTTYERWELPDLRVRKRDGRVEDFDRDKLEVGILKACEKRPIPRAAIVELIDTIEEQARQGEANSFDSSEIGAMVLEGLKRLDQVAYLRFASVYKGFGDVSHFERELKELRTFRQETLIPPVDGGVATSAGAESPPVARGARRPRDSGARHRRNRRGT